MRVPLIINDRMYAYETIVAWKNVWDKICRMAYENDEPVSEFTMVPGHIRIEGIAFHMDEAEQANYYSRFLPLNSDVITLDHMWKYYSKKHGTEMPRVVPEFQNLHVPRSLFESIGINPWFQHSFPNCKVTYWS